MNFLTNLLAPEFIRTIGEAIDSFTTTDEERGRLKLAVLNNQLETIRETNRLELAKLEAKRDIILADAKNDSWLARNWRPITMLMFALTAVAHAFGADDAIARHWFGTDGINEEYISNFFTLLTVGLGGHIIGRSGEKIVKTWKQTPVKDNNS